MQLNLFLHNCYYYFYNNLIINILNKKDVIIICLYIYCFIN